MSGNTFGTLFAVTNFGESHGPAIGCVIDGCPPGMELSEADIQTDLDRRRPGTSRHVTQRNEPDQVEILSGVYEGKTTGTPICLLIRNTDQRSKDYGEVAEKFRPGHADYTYLQKYGIRDPRGGGRSSARLTAPMVAAGAVAKKWLQEKYGTVFRGCMQQLGDIAIPFESWDHVPNNPFFAPVADVSELEAYMDRLRKAGDSCGARIRITASSVPVLVAMSNSSPCTSVRRRTSSATETAGWVSFSWIAAASGREVKSGYCCKWRRRMSCSEAEEKKNSCRRRSSWPAGVASAG